MAISHIGPVAAANVSAFGGVSKASISAINGVTASFGGGGGITFVAAGTFQSSTGTVTPGLPSGTAENDILVMLCFTGNQPITVSGWTEAGNSPQSEGASYGFRLTVFWKRAGASESAPTTSDSGLVNAAQILGFRGCVATGNPFDVTSGSVGATDNTTVTIPGVTTTGANAMVISALAFYRVANSTTNISSGANSNLTDFAERADQAAIIGAVDGGFAAFSGIKASAGATGDTTGTLASSSTKAYWTGALIPA